MAEALRPFHLAVPVNDLAAAKALYCGVLGCDTGRTAERWVDLNFFGPQVSLHLVDDHDGNSDTNSKASLTPHSFSPKSKQHVLD